MARGILLSNVLFRSLSLSLAIFFSPFSQRESRARTFGGWRKTKKKRPKELTKLFGTCVWNGIVIRYGTTTLAEIEERVTKFGRELGVEVVCAQTNYEGENVPKTLRPGFSLLPGGAESETRVVCSIKCMSS